MKKNVEQVNEEIEILKRLLYQNKSQHGCALYYSYCQGGLRWMKRYLGVDQYNGSTHSSPHKGHYSNQKKEQWKNERLALDYLNKACRLFRKSAHGFIGLLGNGFFISIGIVYLSCIANILFLVENTLVELTRKFEDESREEEFGKVVSRSDVEKYLMKAKAKESATVMTISHDDIDLDLINKRKSEEDRTVSTARKKNKTEKIDEMSSSIPCIDKSVCLSGKLSKQKLKTVKTKKRQVKKRRDAIDDIFG